MEINKNLTACSNKDIYMGCGPDIREGFIHCDIRKFDHVDIVCNAWELSNNVMEVNHIYSRYLQTSN